MTMTHSEAVRRPRSGFFGALSLGIGSAVQVLLQWQDRAGQRARLAEMDATMLKDIGITRAEAHREAAKRFWEA